MVNGWSPERPIARVLVWPMARVLGVSAGVLGINGQSPVESLAGFLGSQWLEPWVANGLSYSLVLLRRTR